MGYAMFANRKVMYTNLINTLNMKLDSIMQQKQDILNFSANIADGELTAEEVAGDLGNYTNYSDYSEAFAAYDPYTVDANGNMVSIRDSIQSNAELATEGMDSESAANYIATQLAAAEKSLGEQFAKDYDKKLSALENELDMEQQKIQSKISVAEKQLEAVEQAEAKAIERSTPKYAGVG